jgi:hypothetical protein
MAGLGSGVVRRRLRAPAGRSPAAAAAVAGLAAGAGVAGFVLFLSLVAPPPPDQTAAPGRLAAGDLVLQLQSAGWIEHDDVGGPVPAAVQNGFQMPASMMPGMPEHGTHRLYLEAVLSNAGSGTVAFAPREFAVRAPGGASWPLDQPATFSSGTLRPGQVRSIDLLFDVPESVSQLDLVWTHGGEVQYVQVGATPPPAHDHG